MITKNEKLNEDPRFEKMKKNFAIVISLIAIAVLISACTEKRPVLYPNATYKAAGETVARSDIDDCIQLAADHGHATDSGKNVAGSTAKGAAVGGAVGAVTGRPGRGLAAGAAGGGAGGLARGAMKSGDPDEIERRFVEQCLRDMGYKVIGWK
jgi:uncharacterized protein YcfJ